jgi:hypothetical protein
MMDDDDDDDDDDEKGCFVAILYGVKVNNKRI